MQPFRCLKLSRQQKPDEVFAALILSTMRPILCFLFLFGALPGFFAEGCAGPSLRSSLKNISYDLSDTRPYKGKSDTVSGLDSVLVRITHWGHTGCSAYADLKVYRDNSLIYDVANWNGSKEFSLMGLPGHYKVSCCWVYLGPGMVYTWEFDLIPAPSPLETDSSTTGIPLLSALNPELVIYPNPVRDQLCIDHASEEILYLSVYNSIGKCLFEKDINSKTLTLSISYWPSGHYLVRVFTRSKRVYFKPFIIE